MRFILFIAASLLATLTAGLVIPVDSINEREIDDFEIIARAPIFGIKNPLKYHVKAGGGKPAQTYSRKEVKHAVKAARTEHARISAPGISNRQKKNSPLKAFSNNKHHAPKLFHSKKSIGGMKGSGHEYPLPNKAGAGKGPARVIVQANKAGKLKLKGVVAHDQKRTAGSPGHNDHFRVRPSIRRH
ncbi:hypothetical protein CPB83DRAFT_854943 [Crepidotus variabilis]|uniref:Uncharacterized protein n=1 Tax=Crepidotus variabilis TaxID=179855 RepID=A0A9P6EEN6_9AGAR|nr:hypothetical protein CPB83DRAFT_854943 [Crepidotus variabilis]